MKMSEVHVHKFAISGFSTIGSKYNSATLRATQFIVSVFKNCRHSIVNANLTGIMLRLADITTVPKSMPSRFKLVNLVTAPKRFAAKKLLVLLLKTEIFRLHQKSKRLCLYGKFLNVENQRLQALNLGLQSGIISRIDPFKYGFNAPNSPGDLIDKAYKSSRSGKY